MRTAIRVAGFVVVSVVLQSRGWAWYQRLGLIVGLAMIAAA